MLEQRNSGCDMCIDVFEDEGQIIAKCVEPDICVQADNVWDAVYEWGRLFAAYEQLNAEEAGVSDVE